MAGKIFINYRRSDEPGFAGRLFDRLHDEFGSDRLFMDVDNIAPGLDFVAVLEEQIGQCDVLLAVIGKGWVGATDASGAPQLDSPGDFVRIEIESALRQEKRVIPVLVGDVRMPRPEELPEAIRALARRNAVRLTHERFRADIEGLVKALRRSLDEVEATRQARSEALRGAAIEEQQSKRAATAPAVQTPAQPGAEERPKPERAGRRAAAEDFSPGLAISPTSSRVMWALALALTTIGLVALAYGYSIRDFSLGRTTLLAGTFVFSVGLLHAGLAANRPNIFWLVGLGTAAAGLGAILSGIPIIEFRLGGTLIIAGAFMVSISSVHIALAANRVGVFSLLGLGASAAGLVAIGFGMPMKELTVGLTLIEAGTVALGVGLIHIALAANHPTVFRLAALGAGASGLVAIAYGYSIKELSWGAALILMGAWVLSVALVHIALVARSTVLWLLGLGAGAIGFIAIGYGIPVQEFSFGQTLILAGTTVALAGLTLVHLVLNEPLRSQCRRRGALRRSMRAAEAA